MLLWPNKSATQPTSNESTWPKIIHFCFPRQFAGHRQKKSLTSNSKDFFQVNYAGSVHVGCTTANGTACRTLLSGAKYFDLGKVCFPLPRPSTSQLAPKSSAVPFESSNVRDMRFMSLTLDPKSMAKTLLRRHGQQLHNLCVSGSSHAQIPRHVKAEKQCKYSRIV